MPPQSGDLCRATALNSSLIIVEMYLHSFVSGYAIFRLVVFRYYLLIFFSVLLVPITFWLSSSGLIIASARASCTDAGGCTPEPSERTPAWVAVWAGGHPPQGIRSRPPCRTQHRSFHRRRRRSTFHWPTPRCDRHSRTSRLHPEWPSSHLWAHNCVNNMWISHERASKA